MADEDRIRLAEFLTDLPKELSQAQSQAAGDSLKLGVEEISLTLEVAYTLTKAGETSAGVRAKFYALDVLIRQLALLAGRGSLLPPLSLSERAHDFVDLLDEATRASHERGNRLLVVIDGLDEYDPTAASLELAAWLPGARTLPEQAKLLVASPPEPHRPSPGASTGRQPAARHRL